ncbi:MAG: hypothetical protein Q8M71_04695 [Thermodesulfovibrionales bacterium]|nr:hypothetical protein [Thermodesulfovibrionales bacterium]
METEIQSCLKLLDHFIIQHINYAMRENEADTCRKYVLPKLYASGWNDDQISEQKTFTDGRIVVVESRGIP